MQKHLLTRLQNLLTAHAPEETYLFLRQLLAQNWLRKIQPTALALLSPFFVLPSRKPVIKDLQELLSGVTCASEGTPNALTPESISLLNEMTFSGQGVFYTPFETARQLAQETLLAWLKKQNFVPANTIRFNPKAIIPSQCDKAEAALANLTVCDPACGVGGLLIPFWLELTALRHALRPTENYARLLSKTAKHNLYAADINPHAIQDLRLRLALTLAAHQQPLPTTHFFALDALGGSEKSVWHTACPEIFNQGGFDIYLSNPPYIGQKNHKEIFATLRQNPRWKPVLSPKSDLLYLFFLLAFEIVKPSGVAALLTTSYFAQAAAAYGLRKRLHERACLLRLIDFGETTLFQRAKGQHNLITVFAVHPNENTPCVCGEKTPVICPQKDLFFGPQLYVNTRPPQSTLKAALAKMTAAPYTLKDIASVSNGLMTGCDKAFILTETTKKSLHLTPTEKRKLKPFFKNSDISAYITAQTPRYYLIDFFYPNDRDAHFARYPHLRAHLARFKTQLLARKQNNNGIHNQLAQGKYWFGSVRRKMDFDTEKLVVPHRARANTFAYTPGPWYASSDVYFIATPRPPFTLWYLLALLNSAPYYAWLFYKGKRKGSLLELYAEPLKQIPIVQAAPDVQLALENLARQIYTLKRKNPQMDSMHLQHQIDELVFTLFHFSNEEINAITDLITH